MGLWLLGLLLLQDWGEATGSELAFVQEPGDVVALREHPLLLRCQVEGEPPISISWQRDGTPLGNSSGATLMPDGSLHLGGFPTHRALQGSLLPPASVHEYNCVAQNRYGRLVSRRARVQLASLSRFHQHPESMVVEQGGVARFQCLIRGVPEPTISWEHNRTALSAAHHRFTLLPAGILQITNVGQSDVGTYRCVARNVANTRYSQEAQLALSVSPPRLLQEPEILSGPQNLTLTVHQTAVLECIATGHPRPLVSWSRLGNSGELMIRIPLSHFPFLFLLRSPNLPPSQFPGLLLFPFASRPLPPWERAIRCHGDLEPPVPFLPDGRSIGVEGIQVLGTGNLMISDVSVQHSGVYVCAANRPGTRVRRTAQGVLLVQAPPEFVQWPQSVSKPPGSSAIFTCVAQGVPEPRLIWLKNGKVLSPGENVRLTHNNSTLMLAGVTPADEAIYQCVAENSAGSNQASARLAVTGAPEPPPAPQGLQAAALSASAVRVSWEPPPARDKPSIIGYVLLLQPEGEPPGREVQEAVSKGTFEHVFTNLDPATTYSVRLRAYSAEGASHDSPPVHITTMGNAPAALGFSTKVLNATSVQASWELPPQPGLIQGFKLFHRKLPAAHFEGPLLLASSASSFLYTDLEPAALYEIKLQAFNGNGDGNSTVRFVSLRDALTSDTDPKAGCPCGQDGESPLPGVVVGIHVGLAALIICLLCLLLGWRHSFLCRKGSGEHWAVPPSSADRASLGQLESGGKPGERIELISQVTVEQQSAA
ncbi:immunoglobulin superfamily DCC subclass member 3 isoform X1 [Monodelphis domestica]|uniref:immunoglobulin superfamily DCC subclass member 3 isoform X1 n=1 Tax=Monodelphis domestica TaxID=13616 RepID=UPI0024E1BE26|nr:immunoglobulin superfamily DCC subclass member 3 isoform X1 [Monodelphis domestica]